MSKLIACPFCRELFARGEAETCPSCGLKLADLASLPPSAEAAAEEDNFGIPREPHLEPLPRTDMRRNKGILIGSAVLGLGCFFAPWVNMTSPEARVLAGADLARKSGWIWGAAVGWFVLLPMVVTRRSIDQMRGARVPAAFLSAVPAITALILWLRPPHSRYIPIRFDWGWGLYGTFILGVVASLAATYFGGRIDDIKVTRGALSRVRETLH